ncbi:hypothetical protein TrLO_g4963 [Triparma laevis f. longispina]|uniref:Uncharacterized protein n=1 Tax=Triparma laevis f. longispina TaxID=1714387 RepID=A0A9W7FS52_9STRA|nr:hypothetical protein TrLO_g4963 [Triparma laevis f. longispina]
MDHVEKAAFASSDDGAIKLEFASISFARANTKFCKLEEALKKKTPRNRWSLIVAAAEGFDQVIYQAITGPNRKQYNGSRGETGIDANLDIGIAVCSAFVSVAGEMDVSEFENAIAEVITACTRCEPYGFHNRDCFLGKGVANTQGVFDKLSDQRKEAITSNMATARW